MSLPEFLYNHGWPLWVVLLLVAAFAAFVALLWYCLITMGDSE